MDKIEKIGSIINQTVANIKEKTQKIKKEQQNYAIAKKETKVPVEQNTLEMAIVLQTSPQEQKEGIARREFKNGDYVEIRKVVGKFLCRREDITTLLACFILFKHSENKHGYSFETTYYKLNQMLGDIGGWQYKNIRESLSRLSENNIETNFWWDKGKKERVVRNTFHFLNSKAEIDEEKLKISFDEEIAKSMEQGYIKFLEEKDLKDILKIRSPFAKTLVLLFIKRFWEGSPTPHHINTILEYLGLKDKYEKFPRWKKNKYIRQSIIPAIQEAAKFLGYTVTYNDTGVKNEKGEIIQDPKGEEKFRFYKERQELPFGI